MEKPLKYTAVGNIQFGPSGIEPAMTYTVFDCERGQDGMQFNSKDRAEAHAEFKNWEDEQPKTYAEKAPMPPDPEDRPSKKKG